MMEGESQGEFGDRRARSEERRCLLETIGLCIGIDGVCIEADGVEVLIGIVLLYAEQKKKRRFLLLSRFFFSLLSVGEIPSGRSLPSAGIVRVHRKSC